MSQTRRDNLVQFRLTDDSLKSLDELASSSGRSRGDLARELLIEALATRAQLQRSELAALGGSLQKLEGTFASLLEGQRELTDRLDSLHGAETLARLSAIEETLRHKKRPSGVRRRLRAIEEALRTGLANLPEPLLERLAALEDAQTTLCALLQENRSSKVLRVAMDQVVNRFNEAFRELVWNLGFEPNDVQTLNDRAKD